MPLIIDAPRFDITVTQSLDYRRIPRYIIRYGLEVRKRDTLAAALDEFTHCLNHAKVSEGLLHPDEED